MSRVEITEEIKTPSEIAIAGATVLVRPHGASSPATVYAAITGASTLANPLVSDSDGLIGGWVEPGSYDLVITAAGFRPVTVRFDADSPPVGGIGAVLRYDDGTGWPDPPEGGGPLIYLSETFNVGQPPQFVDGVDVWLAEDDPTVPPHSHTESDVAGLVGDLAGLESGITDLDGRVDTLEATPPSGGGLFTKAEVLTAEATTSTTFGDLTTVGPSITVTVPSGGGLVQLYCEVEILGDGTNNATVAVLESVDIVTVMQLFQSKTAAYTRMRVLPGSTTTGASTFNGAAFTFWMTAGAHTFTVKYKVAAGTATFRNRRLFVRLAS